MNGKTLQNDCICRAMLRRRNALIDETAKRVACP